MKSFTIQYRPAFISLFVILITLNYSLVAHASDPELDEFEARISREARSNTELERRLSGVPALRGIRKRCQAQLSTLEIPAACFRSLDLQLQIGMINPQIAQNQRDALDTICLERSKLLKDARLVESLLSAPVSNKCRVRLVEKAKDLQYRQSADDPLAILKSSVRNLD